MEALPWAHGHQVKGIADYVEAMAPQRATFVMRQTGNQAELSRGMAPRSRAARSRGWATLGNQEAAVKRLSRLIHNERLDPRKWPAAGPWLAQAVLEQAIRQIPDRGRVRLALDWTIEDDQHLLVISLVIKGRGQPIFWRAYAASVLKGRWPRCGATYESV